MDKPRRAPYLQLVVSGPEPEQPSVPAPTCEQLSLFRTDETAFIGIVNMAKISASRFIALLEDTRPTWLVDLRPIPRFDIDRLDRRTVFGLFQKYDIDYRDVTGLLGIYSTRDASLRSGVAADAVARIIAERKSKSQHGPILVLVDDDETAQCSAQILPKQLRPRPKGGWEARILHPR